METTPIRWRFELFGCLRAGAEGHALGRFPTQKTAALLARLVYPPCRLHPREQLVDLLWPDADADSGRNRLSQALVWLRPQLEPDGVDRGGVLRTDRAAVGLSPEAVSSDVADFEAALKSADATGAASEAQIQALVRADDLYRGELLPGHYEDWVLAERSRLAEAHLSALRRLSALYEQAGDLDSALAIIRRVLDADPLQEEAHLDLMRLLAAGGRTAAALRQFQELERLLARELDVAPSPAARALADRIRRAEPPPAAPEAAHGPARFLPLPTPLTRFFGRDAEIARLEQMVQTEGVRLVTLLGTGGSGKTRLALESVARLTVSFAGAVAFVPLAALDDAGAVPAALSAALGLPRVAASPLDDVVVALSAHPCLLVLDNLEHLIDGAAPVVRELLVRLPALTILATSRQRLGVEGEQELSVTPLPLPPSGASPEDLLSSASVQLFVDRARAVRPDFAVTPQNAVAVTRVCERLEGVPLAIELCAAWAQTLTPAQMLTQLARRFDLLVSRRSDIAPRHRTLRAALEYGYVQLTPDLQRVFSFLSVFRGGWTLEAAEAVCVEARGEAPFVLDALTELRERSLLVAEEAGAEMRYRMLEALREFAAEQRTLAVETALRRRHAAYFLRLAEDVETHLTGPQQAVWLAQLETEHDNLRAALSWALETEAQTGLRLASALTTFWTVRGFPAEGQDWLARLLALPPSGGIRDVLMVRATALNAQGHLARARADYAASEAAVQEALGLWRDLADETGMAASLQILATLTYFREDYSGARAFLEEALVLGRRSGKSALIASTLLNLGNIAMELCDWPQAWDLFSESLALCRAEGDPNKVASALNNLGLVARYRNDLEAARTLFQEDLTLCRSLANRSGAAIALLNLGTVERLAGQFDSSRWDLCEAVSLARDVGDRRALAWCVKGLGHLACAEGDFRVGIRLLAASERLRAMLGISFKPADPEELMRDTDLARAVLSQSVFEAAWADGLALPLEAVLAEALSTLPSGGD